jgi:hypothetical protein
MNAREFPHNTPQQAEEYIRGALELVEKVQPPEDLREVAFGKAVDLLSSKQIVYEQPAVVPGLLGGQRH